MLAKLAAAAASLGHPPKRPAAISKLSLAVSLTYKMESFAVAHSGSLSHIHTLAFSPSAVDIAREARIIVTVVVAGWITVTIARGLLSNFGNRRD
jgi:hypothetical protein